MTNKEIFQESNKYARPSNLEENENELIFHGYQEFSLTKDGLDVFDLDVYQKRKHELLKRYLTPRFLFDRTIVDLGANSGLFSYLALQNGCRKATAIDLDDNCLEMIQKGKKSLSFMT